MLNELIIPAYALKVVKQYKGSSDQLGHFLKNRVWDPNQLPDIAILGIPEGRGSQAPDAAEAPDAIRHHLYSLTTFPSDMHIVDLGNIKCGNELKDTYAAVKMVAEELSASGIRLLILGGSQELTVPLVRGLKKKEVDLLIVDDRIDNSDYANCPADELFVDKLPVGTSVSLIAGQSYFIGEQVNDLLADGLNGEIFTLGEIRSDFKELEPLIRQSDLISFDFGSIKAAEAPGQYRLSPNGLTGEEACQIAWYTGISTTPAWFCLFGFSPSNDPSTLGSMMAAQICWYYINGVSKRIDEEPVDEATNFEHYHITVDGLEDPISFLLHPISQRWWMEVPSEDCTLFPVRIPCSKKDYRKACKNEISEKWWKYFNKI
jgi:arginase family enzyme